MRFFLFIFFLTLLSTSAWASFDRGKAAYDQKNWAQAIANLRPAGEGGDARAFVLLGNMYLDGMGVVQNPIEAFGLYRRAALLGNTDAMIATASLYQQGLGTARDIKYAIAWFERAARLGSGTAAFFYAAHLYQGSKGAVFDLKSDPVQAYFWLSIALRNSNTNAAIRSVATEALQNLEKSIKPEDVSKQQLLLKDWTPVDITDFPQAPEDNQSPVPIAGEETQNNSR